MSGGVAVLGFLLFMLAASAAAFGFASARLRALDRALGSGDLDRLRRAALREVRREDRQQPEALGHALYRLLVARRLPSDQLVELGDRALASEHPFSWTCFEVVYRLLEERRRRERREERRARAWETLRARFLAGG